MLIDYNYHIFKYLIMFRGQYHLHLIAFYNNLLILNK